VRELGGTLTATFTPQLGAARFDDGTWSAQDAQGCPASGAWLAGQIR